MHSDDNRNIKRLIRVQIKYLRPGTWYHEILKICKMYNIEDTVETCLKSHWKKLVKKKIDIQQENQIRTTCLEQHKTRIVKSNIWKRQEYVNRCTIQDVSRIMKTRLFAHNIPCNMRSNREMKKCELCGKKAFLQLEHYMKCNGTKRLITSWSWNENKNIKDICEIVELKKMSRLMESMQKLLV